MMSGAIVVDKRSLLALGSLDALIDLIIHDGRLSIPLTSATTTLAHGQECMRLFVSAVGFLIHKHCRSGGVGLQKLEELLTGCKHSHIGLRVVDSVRLSNMECEHSIVAHGSIQGIQECRITVHGRSLFRIKSVQDDNIKLAIGRSTCGIIILEPLARILINDGNAFVVKAEFGSAFNVRTVAHVRQVLHGNLHHFSINFDHGDCFDGFVLQEFANSGTFSSPDNSDVLGVGMSEHCGVNEGLVEFSLTIFHTLNVAIQK
mmetsp:Transcript_7408/g.10830  ORF Transcript_7408/g.10830 Transcript_7408/m.10830 type:complete len:260 (-) Transcript_7408:1060-1839(-)